MPGKTASHSNSCVLENENFDKILFSFYSFSFVSQPVVVFNRRISIYFTHKRCDFSDDLKLLNSRKCLSTRAKFIFSNPDIFVIWCRRHLIFQTMDSVRAMVAKA